MEKQNKPCPVCGGTGQVEDYFEDADFGIIDVVCQYCHGRGTIRPTQDPRYLFWAGRHVSMRLRMDVTENEDPYPIDFHRAHAVAFYAHKKCRAILANKPRRTTATWKGTE